MSDGRIPNPSALTSSTTLLRRPTRWQAPLVELLQLGHHSRSFSLSEHGRRYFNYFPLGGWTSPEFRDVLSLEGGLQNRTCASSASRVLCKLMNFNRLRMQVPRNSLWFSFTESTSLQAAFCEPLSFHMFQWFALLVFVSTEATEHSPPKAYGAPTPAGAVWDYFHWKRWGHIRLHPWEEKKENLPTFARPWETPLPLQVYCASRCLTIYIYI